MSKTMPRKEAKRLRVRFRKQRGLVPISIVLSLVITGIALANWGGSRATPERSMQKNSEELTISGFTANSPSKEMVYSGGRLVATEEEEECSYSISPVGAFYSLAGGEGSVNLTAGVGCEWTASSNPAWLELTSASSGTGSEVISYVVRENFTGVPRQGTVTIAGLTFTVIQDGPTGDCVYVITPTSVSFNASGGTGSVSVFTEERCAWQAVSNATWVTITSACCGIGNAQVAYSVAPNTGSGRAAKITVADKTFNVKQKTAL